MAPLAKKPAMQLAKRARKESDDNDEEEFEKESVLKRPASAGMVVNRKPEGPSLAKRPAGASEDSEDGENSEEEDDESKEDGSGSEEDVDNEAEAPLVMKRPGMAVNKKPEGPSLAKRPAAASEDSEDGEDGEEEEDEKAFAKPMKVSVDVLARQSSNELRKKRRVLERLQKIKDVLAQKMRVNTAAMRAIEKELEGTEAEAQKHGRAAARGKSAKAKAMREKQEARSERARGSANKAIKMAKKRADALKAAYEALQQKADFSENGVKRNQALLNAAEKECKDLAKQGLDVPKPGDTSDWAFSAPTAWHPKEVMAAKARHEAKQAMLKAKEAWEKVNAPAAARKVLWLAAQAKLDAAKQKRKAVDEFSKGPTSKAEGTDVSDDGAAEKPHKKVSAKGKAMKAMKAKKAMKAMKAGNVMKAMKAMKGAKTKKVSKAMKAMKA